MGGLGNQMFQAAHALAQTWKKGNEARFKAESWTPMQGRQTDNYQNNIFRKLNFVENIGHVGRVSEGPWEYTEINPLWDQPQEFYGYFQSSKNFLGYNNDIINMFSPTQDFKLKIFNKFPDLKKEKTISIHIRRGDYLDHSNIHPIIDKSYIDECLNQVGDYDKIYIFSNIRFLDHNQILWSTMIKIIYNYCT